jgi:electron transfer flavoprotein beta subunit
MTPGGVRPMNLVVCLKQVPDTEAPIRIRPDGRGVDESGLSFVMNYYDEHAVEEALRIKERAGGTVTLIAAGPARTAEALRAGLAMGADQAIHIQDPALEGADHLRLARALAAAVASVPYDLVLCGKLATDDNAAVVGPAIAEFLDLPQATAVTRLEVRDGTATAHREVEGAVEVLEVSLPAVVTVERNINEPRYPSLPGIMRAKRTAIAVTTAADLGLGPEGAARVELLGLVPPPRRPPGRILEGEPAAAVRELVRLLRDEAGVL